MERFWYVILSYVVPMLGGLRRIRGGAGTFKRGFTGFYFITHSRPEKEI
jgi:hypothetical protein